jgi:hypothetical protein
MGTDVKVFDAIAAHGRGVTREQAGELRLCSCSRNENELSNTYGCDERLRRLFIALRLVSPYLT